MCSCRQKASRLPAGWCVVMSRAPCAAGITVRRVCRGRCAVSAADQRVERRHRRMEPLQDVPFMVPRPVLDEGTSAAICSSPCALEHERDACVCVCRRCVPLDGVCESAERLLSPGTAAVSQRAGSGGLHLHAGAHRSQTATREQRRVHHVSACGSAAGAPQMLQPSGTAALPISPLHSLNKYRHMHVYIYIYTYCQKYWHPF